MSKALGTYLRLPLLLIFAVGVNCGGSRCQSRDGQVRVHLHNKNNEMYARHGSIDSLMKSRPSPSVYSRSYMASKPSYFVPLYSSHAPGMGVPISYDPIGSKPPSGRPPVHLNPFVRAYRPILSRPAPGYFSPPPMQHLTGRSFAPFYSGHPSRGVGRIDSHAGSSRHQSAPSSFQFAPSPFRSAQIKSAESRFG